MSDIQLFILTAVLSGLAWFFGVKSGVRAGFAVGFNVAMQSRIRKLEGRCPCGCEDGIGEEETHV